MINSSMTITASDKSKLGMMVTFGLVLIALGAAIPLYQLIFMRVILIVIGFFCLMKAPRIRMTATKDGITLHFGIFGFPKRRIEKGYITRVEGLPDGCDKFFGGKFKSAQIGQIPGWRVFVRNVKEPAVAISTQRGNLLLSCDDAMETAKKLREIFGITPPGYMSMKDTGYEAVKNPWER